MEKEQLKARFFGMHIGCPFTHPDFEEPQELWGAAKWQLAKHHGFSGSCFYKDGWVDIERSQLILKPLSIITDEEIKAIANALGFCSEKYKITRQRTWIDVEAPQSLTFFRIYLSANNPDIFSWEGQNAGEYIDGIDYLRSIGFHLSYLGLNPVAEGWAIIEEKQ